MVRSREDEILGKHGRGSRPHLGPLAMVINMASVQKGSIDPSLGINCLANHKMRLEALGLLSLGVGVNTKNGCKRHQPSNKRREFSPKRQLVSQSLRIGSILRVDKGL